MNRLTMQTSLKAVALTIFTVAAILLVTPTLATTAPQTSCWECYTDIEDDDLHWDTDGWYPVSPPDYKHESLGVGWCLDSHQFMCEVDDPEALELLAEALSARDIEGVVAAYSLFRGTALLNLDRKAFQITSCQDPTFIVAHLPIDALSFDAIAVSVTAVAAPSELASQQN